MIDQILFVIACWLVLPVTVIVWTKISVVRGANSHDILTARATAHARKAGDIPPHCEVIRVAEICDSVVYIEWRENSSKPKQRTTVRLPY